MVNTVATPADGVDLLARPSVRALLDEVSDSLRAEGGAFELTSADALRAGGVDRLVRAAVFSADEDVRDTARWLLLHAGRAVGIAPASIHELYLARGRGEVSGFTVPAMNIRAAAYDSARAMFAAARDVKVVALIC
jgi:fructose-bisphosphate aldolase class II